MVRTHPDPPSAWFGLGGVLRVRRRVTASLKVYGKTPHTQDILANLLKRRRDKGGVAQLGERLLCKQEAIGSIPFTSTTVVVGLWAGRTEGNPGMVWVCASSGNARGALLRVRDRGWCSTMIFNNSGRSSVSL